MARKTSIYVVRADNRDKGKIFHLTEMPASQAEKWATRAFLALARSGVNIGDIGSGGMAGIAIAGMQSLASLSFLEAEPLMDEMFACVSYQPDPKLAEVRRAPMEEDIDEVTTRLQLRMEVFALHVGFSSAADMWNSLKAKAKTSAASRNTQTSPSTSAP